MIEELNPIEEPVSPPSPLSQPTPPFPPTQPVPGIPPVPGPGSNLIVKIIAGAIAVSVVGTGTALVARIWDPVWNPFRPSPEKVVEEMLSNIKELKTLHTEAEVSIGVKNMEPIIITGNYYFNYTADIDRNDPQNPKTAGDLEIRVEQKRTQFSVGIGFKTIGETSYFNLTKIPSSLPAEDLAFILKNQWIKTDKEGFKKLFGLYAPDISEQLERQLEKHKQEQAAIIERFKEIIGKRKFYYIKKELSNEKINGKTAYHYLLALDNKELKEMILELSELPKVEAAVVVLLGGELTAKHVLKSLDELFVELGEFTAEVWIDKNDKLLHKVVVKKEIDWEKIIGALAETGRTSIPEERIMDLNIEINLSNFNQSVKIEAPKEYKDLEEIIGPIIQRSRMKAQDVNIKSLMTHIEYTAEWIATDKGDSYISVNCQNKEIKIICDRVKEHTGVEPVIHQSKDEYCAYTKLTSEDKYFCVDSQGSRNESSINPGNRGYCNGITFVCPKDFDEFPKYPESSSEYYKQLFIDEDSFLFQASILEILYGLLK